MYEIYITEITTQASGGAGNPFSYGAVYEVLDTSTGVSVWANGALSTGNTSYDWYNNGSPLSFSEYIYENLRDNAIAETLANASVTVDPENVFFIATPVQTATTTESMTVSIPNLDIALGIAFLLATFFFFTKLFKKSKWT